MGIAGRKRIIIVGGGFGGLYAALRLEKTLARDPDVEILLVNRENFFLFTPMLHEVAASDLDLTHIVNPVRKLLKRVQFFDGDVDEIDLPEKASDDLLLRVDTALEGLARDDARAAELVKLHFFAGLSMGQAAQALGITDRTARRDWRFARAWLFDALKSSAT